MLSQPESAISGSAQIKETTEDREPAREPEPPCRPESEPLKEVVPPQQPASRANSLRAQHAKRNELIQRMIPKNGDEAHSKEEPHTASRMASRASPANEVSGGGLPATSRPGSAGAGYSRWRERRDALAQMPSRRGAGGDGAAGVAVQPVTIN